MSSIVDTLKAMPDYIGSDGRSRDEIERAEEMLGTCFARDYRSYLEEIGLACFDGHELTGLTETARLDVVSVTRALRQRTAGIDETWYVVEDAGIDGIVLWQDPAGKIYQTVPGAKTEKIADSLAEYIGE